MQDYNSVKIKRGFAMKRVLNVLVPVFLSVMIGLPAVLFAGASDSQKDKLNIAWENFYDEYLKCMDTKAVRPFSPGMGQLTNEFYAEQYGYKAKDAFDELKKAFNEADAAGIPANYMLKPSGSNQNVKKGMSYADVKKSMESWAVFSTDPKKGYEESKWGKFYAVLKDDKLTRFKYYKVNGFRGIWTNGGRELKTPADFKNASVWFVYSSYENEIPKRWSLFGIRFQGDKEVKTWEKDGTGSAKPPAKAFK